MKTYKRLLGAFFVILIFSQLTSCKTSGKSDSATDPFNNGTKERNMIVVISDIHLGADLTYAECNKNLEGLEQLLKNVKASKNVKELVIAGDLVDEWFVPATIDTYKGHDQAHFVQRIAESNKGVFDALNSIIEEGKIEVTYVPGNHDLTVTEESIKLILPNIKQARDAELGLGTYSPEGFPQIAIEHGHRYNFFCAPDPFSNQDIAPGTISPPGYFFTRIAALHVIQGLPQPGDTVPAITHTSKGDVSQDLLYEYWKTWKWALNYLTIENKFDEKIIVTNFDGFTGTFSVNDLLPFQLKPGGVIDVGLFKGIQDTWQQRMAHNRVAVDIPAERAIKNAGVETESDEQAKIQYFLNPKSPVRVVVFGHTHIPLMQSSENHAGEKSIYVNSGTWIDVNTLHPTTMNFVTITLQNEKETSETHVKLYNFQNKVATLMSEDSVRL